ncbi:MAG: FAD-dependent oxidoreductase [Hyphomicrobiales bacterium]|nr:FAD-dependent oxidoreductase [Hyphomicrobiales bacterium]
MKQASRFARLFEPVRIGPVTSPNRFYQVPHCTGMGYGLPQTLAAMRQIKAEGGWGVVNTEYCSVHPTSDDTPAPYCSLWDDGDVRNMALMVEGVKRHGALAGVELWHGGLRSSNLLSREVPLGPESLPVYADPWQSQRMDQSDIRAFRQWHRAAALRAREAGFNIIYVYAAHTYLLAQFADAELNRRADSYGGNPENRWRLVRELIEETREAVGETCAIAIRIETDDERGGGQDERRALFATLAPHLDLFNVTISDYSREMGVSRFVQEASLEPFVAEVRSITGKPVVSVGRFTSPETMLSQVRRGVLDFIGAARPSIADPFIPQKIREGRLDDIRECIGCNICYAGDSRGAPIRCTQNPTMGEEWRRNWHPENFGRAGKPSRVLVVGAGPAGLEAAHVLGKRGHQVMLAEARDVAGGRVVLEAALPGLSEWKRVADYRQHQISKLPNVELFRASRMTAGDIIDTGAAHVILATGSHWRADGRGRHFRAPQPGFAAGKVLTPDDVMAGTKPVGPVVVFDDDGYYMGSVIAELLAVQGHAVTYVATAGIVSAWSENTAEQARVQARLIELGVEIIVSHAVTAANGNEAVLTCIFSGRERRLPRASLVSVTSREPDDALWQELRARDASFESLVRIGDCRAPGIIAMAVHDGHLAGRMLGEAAGSDAPKRERVVIAG